MSNEPTTEAGRALLDRIAPLGSYATDDAEQYEMEGDEIRWRAKYAESILAIEAEALAASRAETAAAVAALDFRASTRFTNLPHQPTGPELLRAIAIWMDKVDDERGQQDRGVQADLRKWADKAEAVLTDLTAAAQAHDAEIRQRGYNVGYVDGEKGWRRRDYLTQSPAASDE